MIPPTLFDTAIHFTDDLFRNIVSLRETQNLADDLSEDADDGALFAKAEMATKARLPAPTINRPFEPGYGIAVQFPFVEANWFSTRYSDGRQGAWYGSTQLDTTIYETTYWFRKKLIEEVEGFGAVDVAVDRRVFQVAADALMIDLRGKQRETPALVDRDSYTFCQAVGRELIEAGHPGAIVPSARCEGDNAVLFNPRYLSNVRDYCYLTYRFRSGNREVVVERAPRIVHLVVPADH